MTGTPQPDPQAVATDWTRDPETGRSNSSPEFRRLVQHVGELIGSSHLDLARGRHDSIASLVVANLAHVHGMRPALPPARIPLTETDIPAGQGPASLHLARDRFTGRLALWFKADDGALHFIQWAPGPGDTPPTRALWDLIAATVSHVTTEET